MGPMFGLYITCGFLQLIDCGQVPFLQFPSLMEPHRFTVRIESTGGAEDHT